MGSKALEPWRQEALARAIDGVGRAAAEFPGYPPALRPVAVAQFVLESNWGRADMGAYNFFGIKAREGEPWVELTTTEVVNGQVVRTRARFRRFESPVECFAAHARLFHRTRGGRKIYERALSHAHDPAAFADALTGVYATDPAYGTKLRRLMQDLGLYETFGFEAPR